MNKKLLIGMVVIVTLAFGVYFLVKTMAIVPEVDESKKSFGVIDKVHIDTSGWAAYTNEVLGFGMQVPPDTVVKFEDSDPRNKIVILQYEKSKLFEVRLDNVNGRRLEGHFFYVNSNLPYTETTLAGQRALIFFQILHGEGGVKIPESVTVATEHNGYFYDVTFFDIGELSSSEEKILSTFKFTK